MVLNKYFKLYKMSILSLVTGKDVMKYIISYE